MIEEKELIDYLKENLKIKTKTIDRYHDMAYDGTYEYTCVYLGDELITSERREV